MKLSTKSKQKSDFYVLKRKKPFLRLKFSGFLQKKEMSEMHINKPRNAVEKKCIWHFFSRQGN